jgi:methionyl-tRNA formyltransferase
MRIFIITMDDPIQTRDFIKHIIHSKQQNIIGLAEAKGDRMTIGKNKSKIEYIFSLLLIMGFFYFTKNSLITIMDKIKKKLSKFKLLPNPSIGTFAEKMNIPTYYIKSANNKEFLEMLRSLKPDIIINQSQSIIKKDLLEIPTIGVINRHNALLPKNRGRLTPFWVLLKNDDYTGVSIHFVNEGIDAGDIIVQKKYKVSPIDTFNSIVKKNYEIAPKAIIEAIELLEKGQTEFISNNDEEATYNTVPSLKDAIQYRKKRLLLFR